MKGCGRRIGPFDCCTIIEGDCLNIMPEMPDGCMNLIVTDPPYGIKFKSHSAKVPRFNILINDEGEFDLAKCWQESWRITRTEGALYFYCRWDVAHRWSGIIKPDSQIVIPRGRCSMGDLANYSVEYEIVLFRRKGKHVIDATPLKIPNNSHIPNPPPFKRRIGNLWLDVISNEAWERARHPTQKTVESALKMILISSDKGDSVFDPFCGSGTALVAAKQAERHFFGCDIDPEYVGIAQDRLSSL
jgi:site-specific DNA-methyltransferase (adenine-specific)